MSEKKKIQPARARGMAARVEAGGYVDGADEAGSAGGVGIGPAWIWAVEQTMGGALRGRVARGLSYAQRNNGPTRHRIVQYVHLDGCPSMWLHYSLYKITCM